MGATLCPSCSSHVLRARLSRVSQALNLCEVMCDPLPSGSLCGVQLSGERGTRAEGACPGTFWPRGRERAGRHRFCVGMRQRVTAHVCTVLPRGRASLACRCRLSGRLGGASASAARSLVKALRPLRVWGGSRGRA
eukprot:6202728-Pleurochrysis_carterae.AAC.2